MVTTHIRHSQSTRGALVLWFIALLLTPGISHAQAPSGLVVFGTSLSDPGNAFVLRGDHGVPPDFTVNPLLIPDAPYARGGHHFSDGATWIEQYGRSIGLGDSVKAALASTDGSATNYAVGAARAYDDGVNFNLTRQVDTFLAQHGGVASPNAVYVIEMGGNDIRDALALYAAGGNGGPILARAIGSIAGNIQKLYIAGARRFLVWTAPNVGLTPAIRSLGPAAGGLATQLAQAFNGNLALVIAQLSSALPGAQFQRLDAYTLLNAIVADPASFGLTNASTACLTPNDAPFTCDAPSTFLFWDGIHPTKSGHGLIAAEAANVLR